MKKIALLLITVIAAQFAMAEGHLKFKGVEIDGPKEQMAQKLKEVGFKDYGTKKRSLVLTGKFNGVDDCFIVIIPDDQENAYAVSAVFPAKKNWEELYTDYLALREQLKQKYPILQYSEGFQDETLNDFSNTSTEINYLRYAAAVDSKYTFMTTFQAEGGDLTLGIVTNNKQVYVGILYTDTQNRVAYISRQKDL